MLAVLALLGGAKLTLMAAHPAYWQATAQAVRTQPTAPVLPHGIEPGGGHYLGAEHPVVTIIEFSDYECPYCRQAHTQMRDLLERFPTRLRLVHRHYPLDGSCNSSIKARMHENACFAATVAECAGRQDRFWQANDYLFAEARTLHARPNAEIARDLGLDKASWRRACARKARAPWPSTWTKATACRSRARRPSSSTARPTWATCRPGCFRASRTPRPTWTAEPAGAELRYETVMTVS